MRLYSSGCISVHQVRSDETNGYTTVVMVKSDYAEAVSVKSALFSEYEKYYPTEYPKKTIFIYLDNKQFTDNFKEVYDKVEQAFQDNRIVTNDPDMYAYSFKSL